MQNDKWPVHKDPKGAGDAIINGFLTLTASKLAKCWSKYHQGMQLDSKLYNKQIRKKPLIWDMEFSRGEQQFDIFKIQELNGAAGLSTSK